MRKNQKGTPRDARRESFAESIDEMLRLLRLDGEVIELGTYRDQVYSYETDEGWQYHWSIAEAKKRAEARGELTTISLSDAGMTLEMVRLMNHGMDETYAMTTDLLKPVLFVPFYPERDLGRPNSTTRVHVLVDGWHRVFHAVSTGVDILPCYVLTEEDAQVSLIIKLPPGQGLPFDDTSASADAVSAVVVEEDDASTTIRHVSVSH